jgi:carboxypeptidase Taq
VSLSRKKADLLGYTDHPYDALLDLYEPEAKTKDVEKVFKDITIPIVDLLKKITSRKPTDNAFLHAHFAPEEQITFGHRLLDAMGYDKTKGRLDFSAHPFSTAFHPTDSRITTTVKPSSLLSNISSILHEGGHSLYEMGLPVEHFGTPLCEALSLGMHESQSRWWETRIGLSKPFWKHFFPLLKTHFPSQLNEISLDKFYEGINKVSPSYIRVDADEVTYSLHIILRFQIEKGLIEGSLKVRDIPEIWNAKMQELLGITPSNYAEGCLQDIHWATGAIGYFPTYTLGNLYAAHLFEAFEKQNPDWEHRVEVGDLGFINAWLHENVHRHGRRYTCQELLFKATGKEFTSKAYVTYLNNKYGN